MKTTTIAAFALLLATSAQAQQPLANPYANCIAEASPLYGSLMTIENLREYMGAHPECQNGGEYPRPDGTAANI